MEGHRDLRKFTTGTVVAERCGVLSSGREARGDISRRRVRAQRSAVRTDHWGGPVRCSAAATDRRIDNVKRLTPWWVIGSLTTLDSDQKAAEALQEAETEVGLGPMVGFGAKGAARAPGPSYRQTYPVIDVGLTA